MSTPVEASVERFLRRMEGTDEAALQRNLRAGVYGPPGSSRRAVVELAVESRAKEPIVPLDLWRSRTYSASMVSTFFAAFAFFGAIVFLPRWFQVVESFTPTNSGLAALPLVVGAGGRVLSWIEHRPALALLLILLLASVMGIVQLSSHPPNFNVNWENRWWQIGVNVARGEGYVACKTIYFPFCSSANQVTAMRVAGSLPQNVNFAAKIDKATPLLAGVATRGRAAGGRSMQSLVHDYEKSVRLVIAR